LADFPATLAALVAEGFTVASLEYRLAGEARYPPQLQDANATFDFFPRQLGVQIGQWAAHQARYGLARRQAARRIPGGLTRPRG